MISIVISANKGTEGWSFGFGFAFDDAIISNVGMGHNQHLAGVGRVRKCFLIPRHGCVEAQLAGNGGMSTCCQAVKFGAVLQSKHGFVQRLRLRHGAKVDRNAGIWYEACG